MKPLHKLQVKRRLFVPLLLAFFLLSCFIGLYQIPTASATDITTYPYVITTGGADAEHPVIYNITSPASTSAAVAISINTNNVIIDGGNNLLTGLRDSYGILCNPTRQNITVLNMNMDGFKWAIKFDTTTNVLIKDSTLLGSGVNQSFAGAGVQLTNCVNAIAQDCVIDSYATGSAYANGGSYITFDNITSHNTHHGGVFQRVDYGQMKNNHNYGSDSVSFQVEIGNNVNVTDNYSINAGNITGLGGNGVIEAYSLVNGRIERNTVLNWNGTSITAGLRLSNVTNVYVENNTFASSPTTPFNYAPYGSFITVKDGGVSSAVLLKHNVISGVHYGIFASSGMQNITSKLNLYQNCTNPIYLISTIDTYLLHNAYDALCGSNVYSSVTNNNVNDTACALVVSKVGEGTVSPDVGTHAINGGNWSITATATASAHYTLASIEFASVDYGASSPTYLTLETDSALQFSFDESEFEITPTANAHTTITPNSAAYYAAGSNQQFTYSASTGYHISEVLVDGTPISLVTYPSSYTFTDIQDSHTIEVSAEINTYNITAIQGSNGAITPSGVTTKDYGTYQEYNITANTHYHITDVLVDGYSIGVTSTANFTNIQANHNITATFSIDTYNITVIQGSNGALAPTGVLVKDYGDNQTITVTPTLGYHISDVLVDAVSVGAVSNYTFTTISAAHNITATFESDVYPSPPPTATPTASPTPTATAAPSASNTNFMLITIFTTIFSFLFFILGTREGIGAIGNIDFARALIYYFVSLLCSILCVALYLSMDTAFAVAYWYIPLFLIFMNLALIVFTGWKAYLHKVEGTPNRNRRYDANRDTD